MLERFHPGEQLDRILSEGLDPYRCISQDAKRILEIDAQADNRGNISVIYQDETGSQRKLFIDRNESDSKLKFRLNEANKRIP
jgi:hypothetical protein